MSATRWFTLGEREVPNEKGVARPIIRLHMYARSHNPLIRGQREGLDSRYDHSVAHDFTPPQAFALGCRLIMSALLGLGTPYESKRRTQ